MLSRKSGSSGEKITSTFSLQKIEYHTSFLNFIHLPVRLNKTFGTPAVSQKKGFRGISQTSQAATEMVRQTRPQLRLVTPLKFHSTIYSLTLRVS
jgi:hypothetical protein